MGTNELALAGVLHFGGLVCFITMAESSLGLLALQITLNELVFGITSSSAMESGQTLYYSNTFF